MSLDLCQSLVRIVSGCFACCQEFCASLYLLVSTDLVLSDPLQIMSVSEIVSETLTCVVVDFVWPWTRRLGRSSTKQSSVSEVSVIVCVSAIVAGCTVLAAVGIVGAGVCWYK